MKKLVSTLLGLILIISMSALSYAGTATEEYAINRMQYIDDKIAEIGSRGPAAVDEWLGDNGIIKLNITPEADTYSQGGNMSVYNLNAYYDRDTHKYIFKGWWKWNSITNFDLKTGSADKVAIAISTNTGFNEVSSLNIADGIGGISVYDSKNNSYPDAGSITNVDGSGAIFDCQDDYSLGRYIGYKGQAWVWADNIAPGTYKLMMNYAHTYDNCSFEEFSIGWDGTTPSVNATFSNSANGWNVISMINFSI